MIYTGGIWNNKTPEIELYKPPWNVEVIYSDPEILSIPSYRYRFVDINNETGDIFLVVHSYSVVDSRGIYKIINEDFTNLIKTSTINFVPEDILVD